MADQRAVDGIPRRASPRSRSTYNDLQGHFVASRRPVDYRQLVAGRASRFSSPS